MKKVAASLSGLTKKNLNTSATPFLHDFNKKKISTINPLVSGSYKCSVQTTYLTGKWPNEYGIVGNGWFDKNHQKSNFALNQQAH